MTATPDISGALLEEARARVQRAADAIERALHPPPERRQRMLEQRAGALLAEAGAGPTACLSSLVFSRGGARFAIDACHVHEVASGCRPERLPAAPPAFAGVVELRGAILPLVALEFVLGLPAGGPRSARYLVVLGGADPELAVAADSVTAGNAETADVQWVDAAALLDDPRLRGEPEPP